MSEQFDRMQQSQAARRANLAKWRESKLHETTLPSGLCVVLRDVTLTDLLFTGKLPESMLDIANVAAGQGNAEIDLKQLAKNGNDLRALVDEITKLCMVEPPIADLPDEEHLGLDELSGDDKMFIFNWANREVEQVRSFREGEAQPVETV